LELVGFNICPLQHGQANRWPLSTASLLRVRESGKLVAARPHKHGLIDVGFSWPFICYLHVTWQPECRVPSLWAQDDERRTKDLAPKASLQP